MEQNKNKFKDKLTVKNINRTFPIIIFVLVFICTFLWTLTPEFKEHPALFWSIAAGVIILVGITWLVMALVVKHKKDKADVNKQNIKKALDKLESETKENNKKEF